MARWKTPPAIKFPLILAWWIILAAGVTAASWAPPVIPQF